MRKRCVALLLAVLILGSLAAPALAAGSEPVTSTGTFWQAVAADSPRVIGNLIGIFSEGTCAVSEDRRHHGKVIRKADPVFGAPGAWLALCDYCGEEFEVYDDDMQNVYDEHVGSLPTSGFTSDGCLLWYVQTSDLSSLYLTNHGNSAVVRPSSITELPVLSTDVRWTYDDRHFFARYVGAVLGKEWLTISCDYDIQVPITGLYTLFDAPVRTLVVDGVSQSWNDWNDRRSVSRTSGSIFHHGQHSVQRYEVNSNNISASFELPSYKIATDIDYSATYSIDSRVGTFSGNFGYYGDNGQLVVAENIQIVNEGDNTFYNPATGTTAPVSNWTYDYSDRSYHLTLEGGDTVTVTYGDENVTINQGGDTYNIYYIVPGGGEVEPTPTPPPTDPPTPTETVSPTDPPGPTEPVDPDAPPDTTGWGILDFLKGIFDFLWDLGGKLMGLLHNLLVSLFMPKEESIKELEDKVAEKLPFISDLQDFGDQFSDVLHNPAKSARSMKFTTVVDLGRKSGGVSYGSGQANILDMTWYLEYKPMVDDIIEGVAWLVFLWNLYGALPAIIHGGASGMHTTAGLVKWKEENDDVR